MAGKREDYVKAAALIAKSRRILISGHLSPDGDALGSMLALARLLNNAGKQAFAAADLNSLGKPAFLEGVKDMIAVRKLKRQRFDLFIAVDCLNFKHFCFVANASTLNFENTFYACFFDFL